jgi:hypothetical protein
LNHVKFRKHGSILPEPPSPILYTSHLDGNGVQLFKAACDYDLEGLIAKRKHVPFESDDLSAAWIKIKNPLCSQIHGGSNLFNWGDR